MKRDGRGSTGSDSSGPGSAGIGETAIRKGTGKGWGEWYGLLDAAGAREKTHLQIIAVVARHQAGEWWQQTITVAYEEARGIRSRHQMDDGFSANASKTILAGVTRLFDAWVDDDQRASWLDASGWHIRKSTPYKNLRITWVDGRTHVDVHLWPRGEGRTLIQIEHSKLGTLDDVQRLKAFWGVALERLRKLTEPITRPAAVAV